MPNKILCANLCYESCTNLLWYLRKCIHTGLLISVSSCVDREDTKLIEIGCDCNFGMESYFQKLFISLFCISEQRVFFCTCNFSDGISDGISPCKVVSLPTIPPTGEEVKRHTDFEIFKKKNPIVPSLPSQTSLRQHHPPTDGRDSTE